MSALVACPAGSECPAYLAASSPLFLSFHVLAEPIANRLSHNSGISWFPRENSSCPQESFALPLLASAAMAQPVIIWEAPDLLGTNPPPPPYPDW